MERKLIADVCPDETRVALLDDGQLSEFYVETIGKERLVGNIYKGKAMDILPGMQAAFIDIGLDKNAFLYAGDIVQKTADGEQNAGKSAAIPKISDLLNPNQEILVQVLKQPGGTKGARVTTHISLPGRLVVLMPMEEHVGISRRITDPDVRERLKKLAEQLRPEGMGIVLRTAAAQASEEELAEEVEIAKRLWKGIQEKAAVVSAPRLVHTEESLLFRTVRDVFTEDVGELVVNDRDAYERTCELVSVIAPALRSRVKYYAGDMPIFDVYALEDRTERLLQRRVWLRNGAYLVIDETEALTVIDVNTGKYTGTDNLEETILKANLEAADEIGRQLRLRDLSGIIIVDFIDMESEKSRQQVLERLESVVSTDSTRTHVLGMTHLGLVEMTRKRVRRKLSTLTQTTCPTCGGSGRIPNVEALTRKVRLAVMRYMENGERGTYVVEAAKPVVDHILVRNSQGTSILPKYPGSRFFIRPAQNHDPEYLQILTAGDLSGAQLFH